MCQSDEAKKRRGRGRKEKEREKGENLPVGDVGLNTEKHLRGSLGNLDKDTVVDLEETEKLQDLAGLGGNVVDTRKQGK